jgi:hypothetical protein
VPSWRPLAECLGHGNGLDDGEFCVVLSTESQCTRERRPGRSGEINRTKDSRKFNHDQSSVWKRGGAGGHPTSIEANEGPLARSFQVRWNYLCNRDLCTTQRPWSQSVLISN